MADLDELDAETAALKSGLGPFYGRILAALERLADAFETETERRSSLKAKVRPSTDA